MVRQKLSFIFCHFFAITDNFEAKFYTFITYLYFCKNVKGIQISLIEQKLLDCCCSHIIISHVLVPHDVCSICSVHR